MGFTMAGIAFVGCGFVADFYFEALAAESNLQLIGVLDQDSARAEKFGAFYRVPVYPTMAALLADHRVDIVVNLTNPSSHYAVTAAALHAGKHVYSEKPFTLSMVQAYELDNLAKSKGLQIVSAPCTLFGEAAQTIQSLLQKSAIGKVRLVYAEMDDGPVHLANPQSWTSASGTPWPCKDEYEVGCTFEHAGYYVSWLVAFFGPASEVYSYSDILVPDKGVAVDIMTPDFTVACIRFKSDVVARLTCSIYAPHDHELKIIGDEGVISLDEAWHHADPVRLRRYSNLGFKSERYAFIRKNSLLRRIFGLYEKKMPWVRKPQRRHRWRNHHIDRCRGLAEMADAIQQGQPSRLSGDFNLHVNEIVLAIQNSKPGGMASKMQTSCAAPALLFSPTP